MDYSIGDNNSGEDRREEEESVGRSGDSCEVGGPVDGR